MMNRTVTLSTTIAVMSSMVLGTFAPVLAESMWVPRLGYTVEGSKRIYVEAPAESIREPGRNDNPAVQQESDDNDDNLTKAEKRARKAEAKARREAQREQQAQAEQEQKAQAKALKKATAKSQKSRKVETLTSVPESVETIETKAIDSDSAGKHKKRHEKTAKAERPRHDRDWTPEKIAQDRERAARINARWKEYQDRKTNKPVEGEYFLYDLKVDRLLLKESAELVPDAPSQPLPPSFVEFRETALKEGLYDLAVRGSGHRSASPIRVSDAIYWDALKPVMQDMQVSHCPEVRAGKFQILHQCFYLQANNPMADSPDKAQVTVQGGWYTDDPASEAVGMVKNTVEIANSAQMLMRIYGFNPQSAKYIVMNGDSYLRSKLPDVLDEANWGLQYLMTVQQVDGSFPAGVQRDGMTGQYKLMPATPESTARAIMALATAVKAFKSDDLSLSVKAMRSAERGWQYLSRFQSSTDPQWMLMASAALSEVSDKPAYYTAYATARSAISSGISAETALLLGPLAADLPINPQTGEVQGLSMVPAQMVYQLGRLSQGDKSAQPVVAEWLNSLYGYEEVSFVHDPKLELVAAWHDPLQWAATSIGNSAQRLGQGLSDKNIVHGAPNVDSERLKALEDKEKQTFQRMVTGYKKLKPKNLDRVYLAYTLAQLNQVVAPGFDPAKPPETKIEYRNDDSLIGPKGYYPNPLGGRQPYMK